MKNLKIGTWNIKNSYFHLHENELKVAAVIQLLRKENLDILTLQEVNPLLVRKLDRKLEEMNSIYRITSSHQNTKNPIKNLRVEYNIIISKLKSATQSFSTDLPYLPKGFELVKNVFSIRKRFIISQVLENDILVDTTHLDHSVEELGKRQLEKLVDLLKYQRSGNCDVFLTGNLNKNPTELSMISFQEKVSKIGMKVVDNPHKTYIGHQEEQPVDYVVVPDNYCIQSVETLENYDDISTHRPVVVEVKKR